MKDCVVIRFLCFSTFFNSLKVFLINMIAVLMMSANLASLCLHKRMIFLNKGFDVIISVNNVTSKILPLT